MAWYFLSWEGASWISSFYRLYSSKSNVFRLLPKYEAPHPPKPPATTISMFDAESEFSNWCRCETEWECKYMLCNKIRVVPWEDSLLRAFSSEQQKRQVWEHELRGAPFDLKQLENAGNEFKILAEAILQPVSVFVRFLEQEEARLRHKIAMDERDTGSNSKTRGKNRSYNDILIYLVERILAAPMLPRTLYPGELTGYKFEKDRFILLREALQECSKKQFALLTESLTETVESSTDKTGLSNVLPRDELTLQASDLLDDPKSQKPFEDNEDPDAITPLPLSDKPSPTKQTETAVPIIRPAASLHKATDQYDSTAHEGIINGASHASDEAYFELPERAKDPRKDSGVGINDRGKTSVSQGIGEQSNTARVRSCPSIREDEDSTFDPQNESDFDVQEMFSGPHNSPSQEDQHNKSGIAAIPENGTPAKSNLKKTQKTPAKRNRKR